MQSTPVRILVSDNPKTSDSGQYVLFVAIYLKGVNRLDQVLQV